MLRAGCGGQSFSIGLQLVHVCATTGDMMVVIRAKSQRTGVRCENAMSGDKIEGAESISKVYGWCTRLSIQAIEFLDKEWQSVLSDQLGERRQHGTPRLGGIRKELCVVEAASVRIAMMRMRTERRSEGSRGRPAVDS